MRLLQEKEILCFPNELESMINSLCLTDGFRNNSYNLWSSQNVLQFPLCCFLRLRMIGIAILLWRVWLRHFYSQPTKFVEQMFLRLCGFRCFINCLLILSSRIYLVMCCMVPAAYTPEQAMKFVNHFKAYPF